MFNKHFYISTDLHTIYSETFRYLFVLQSIFFLTENGLSSGYASPNSHVFLKFANYKFIAANFLQMVLLFIIRCVFTSHDQVGMTKKKVNCYNASQ